MEMSTIRSMQHGPLRRQAIIQFILNKMGLPSPYNWKGLPVNNKWELNIQHDKDLQYLLKKGKLKRIRDARYRSHYKKVSAKRQTWLVVNLP